MQGPYPDRQLGPDQPDAHTRRLLEDAHERAGEPEPEIKFSEVMRVVRRDVLNAACPKLDKDVLRGSTEGPKNPHS